MNEDQQTTAMHVYHGRALADLQPNSLMLEVFSAELTPGAASGTFAPGVTTSTVTIQNEQGGTESTQEKVANHIVAEWFGESNRSFPPSVVQGEQVLLYQIGNTDKFYWKALGRDKELRTTEVMRWEISATSNRNSTKSDTNTYFVELDSKNQHFLIKTSATNGELFAYAFKIDCKNGQMVFTDNSGTDDTTGNTPANSFFLDSTKHIIQMTNSDGSVISIHDKDILVQATRDMIMSAHRQILFDSPNITFNRTQTGAIVMNAGYFSGNIVNDTVWTGARYGIDATTKISGPVSLGATCAVSLAISEFGDMYSPTTINLDDGTATDADNTEIVVDASGTGNRHVAAWEQVNAAFGYTVSALKSLASAANTTVSTDGISQNATNSEMMKVMGV